MQRDDVKLESDASTYSEELNFLKFAWQLESVFAIKKADSPASLSL